MTETKSESFHRLAGKRVETIEDALRIFSNLSGPSYEWTPAEVETYFSRIDAAKGIALQRFTETKRWTVDNPTPPPADEPEEPAEALPAPVIAKPAAIPLRQAEMLRIWDEAGNEQGILLEMIAMQREVIANLQRTIDGRAPKET
jgi:hypothetical protein